jgi:nucleoside-triphosphatase
MGKPRTKLLLTGPPGCGKTTAVMSIAAALDRAKTAGFYTREIRVRGTRKGFRWNRLDGPSGILAHVDIQSRCRVGKYGVDVKGFEDKVVPILNPDERSAHTYMIDEIGKMECFSDKFVGAVRRLLDSDKTVLATVAARGSGLIEEVKKRGDVILYRLTTANRVEITDRIIELLSP